VLIAFQRSADFNSALLTRLPMMEVMIPRPNRRQLVFSAIVVAVVASISVAQWNLVREAAGQIASLPRTAALLLVAAIITHRLIQSALVATVTGTIGIGRGWMINEAHTGCSNAMIGGGAVGTGLRAAMMRSWGIDGPRVATSIAASSVIPMIMQWFVTAAAAGFFIASGDRSTVNHLALIAGIVLSIGPLAFWAAVLTQPRAVRRAATLCQPVVRFMANLRITRRLAGRQATSLRHLDVAAEAERIRSTALPLLGRRGGMALVLGLASQLAVGAILIVALTGLTATTGVTMHPVEVMASLAFARTLGSFAPLPSGIGLLDAGLLASLTANGLSRPSAVAAVAIYRASTFLVPILTGILAVLVWRRTARHYNLTMPARTAANTA
jgi:uncharacterized membrane protein YbhN (UPF0104 family)